MCLTFNVMKVKQFNDFWFSVLSLHLIHLSRVESALSSVKKVVDVDYNVLMWDYLKQY